MHKFLVLLSILFIANAAKAQNVIYDSMEVDGRTRLFILFLPDKITNKAPLVFTLHGYGGSAKDMMEFSKMNEVAEQNGFVVCYPQGVFGPDHKNSWNAGYSNDDVDDVTFLTTLAKHIQSNYGCNEKNTFCTGMSNGADMSYVLACRASEVFSAIAPVAGCMMDTTYDHCLPGKKVPVFEIHGTNDDITLWDGDDNYSEKYGGYKSVRETIDFWIRHNDCQLEETTILPDTNLDDHSHIITEKYTNQDKYVQVLLYKIVHGKHDWPGSWGNMDINIAKEIWKFFNQFIKK